VETQKVKVCKKLPSSQHDYRKHDVRSGLWPVARHCIHVASSTYLHKTPTSPPTRTRQTYSQTDRHDATNTHTCIHGVHPSITSSECTTLSHYRSWNRFLSPTMHAHAHAHGRRLTLSFPTPHKEYTALTPHIWRYPRAHVF